MTQIQWEATTTYQSSSTPASSLLVVDDNSMNRIMLSRYITKLGYRAALTENGRQALEKLQGEPYDLGQLALVFQEMACQVYAREQQLQQQVHQLRIEIDQERSAREVAEITESGYFQQLLGKAQELRNRARGDQDDGMQEQTAREPD